jgi:AraC-like DNA-binding protein
MDMGNSVKFLLPDPLVWFESTHFSFASSSPWHSHPDWQMSVSLEGVFAFKLRNGKSYFFEPGQIALLPPGVPHLPSRESKQGHYAQIFFRYFSPELFPEPAQKFNLPPGEIFSAKSNVKSFSKLVNTINQRCKTTDPLCLSWRIMLSNTFLLQAAELLCKQCDSIPVKVPQTVPKALEYLEKHYNNDICVADAARHVGLSVSRFSAVFHAATGSSPLRHLNLLRLSKAQVMLLNDFSVKEAAMENGFGSVEYFCRFFKQKTGKTPSEFKKSPFTS